MTELRWIYVVGGPPKQGDIHIQDRLFQRLQYRDLSSGNWKDIPLGGTFYIKDLQEGKGTD